MQFLRGKSIVQFICALAIAVVSVLHVDASFASTPSDCLAVSVSQDDDDGPGDKVVADLCNFCSGTAALTDVVTPSNRQPVRQAVPASPARRLAPFSLPATAPPPRS